MLLEGKYIVQASRNDVWSLISNPERVANCLPGLLKFEAKGENTFIVTIQVAVSFFKPNFKFTFTLTELTPPSHVRFQATGGGAGVSIKMDTSMDLSDTKPGSTELSWKTDTELGGLLGELSPSVLKNRPGGFTEQFLNCINKQLEIPDVSEQ